MVQPRINADPSFLQFADEIARGVSGGQGRLNPNDPDSVRKLFGHVDQKAAEFEQVTGQPKENTFKSLFDQTVGKVTGGIGRGALGVGRAIGEGPVGRSAGNIISPGAGRAIEPSLGLLDDISKTSGGIATETLVAPMVSPIIPGNDSFSSFAEDLRRRQQGESVRNLVLGAPQREAFRESEIHPVAKLGIEAAADVTNFLPGVGFVGSVGRTGIQQVAVQAGRKAAAEAIARGAGKKVAEEARRVAMDAVIDRARTIGRTSPASIAERAAAQADTALRQTAEEVAQAADQNVANAAIREGSDLGEAAVQGTLRTEQPPATLGSRVRGAIDAVNPLGTARAGFLPDDTGANLASAVTGRPYTGKTVRGFGRDVREEVFNSNLGARENIFGDATYSTPSREFASEFGPQIEEINVVFRNPLVISTDAEYRRIAQQAGLRSFVPANSAEVARLRAVIESRGHDGVIIRVPESELTGKRLQQAFGEDTIVDFRAQRPDVTARAAGPEDVPLTPAQQLEQEIATARSKLAVDPTARISSPVAEITDGPIGKVGSVTADGTVILPRSDPTFAGLRTPDLGVTRAQTIINRVKGSLPERVQGAPVLRKILRTDSDQTIDALWNVRKEMIDAYKSRGVAVSGRIGPAYRDVFQPDANGLIPSLAGNPDIPGAPTLQDIAARLPQYQDLLTPSQRRVLEEIRVELEPYSKALREIGDDFGQRKDIMEGGFYIPRGGAATVDGPNLPFSGGRGRPGSTPGFERPAPLASQAEGISKGHEYPRFEQTLAGHIERAGRRLSDQFTSNYLATAREVDGTKFGLTAKELLLRDNPKIAAKMATLRGLRDRLSSLAGSKLDQQMKALDQLISDPLFDDIDGVRSLFSKVRIRGGGLDTAAVENRAVLGVREVSDAARKAKKPLVRSQTVQRGARKGQDVEELRAAVKAVRQAITEFKPDYDAALKRATGRDRLGIGRPDEFPQLNGKTFPERMAARANQLIAEEQSSLPGSLETINQAQQLFKGMEATLDNSGVGIQALLSAYANPQAFQRGLRANIRSFGTPAAYGDWARGFNAGSQVKKTLSLEKWTDFGLTQISGVDTEVTSVLAERIPVVGKVFKGANRAFSTVSNVVRAEWAEDLLLEELAKGRLLDEIISSGDIRRITTFVNNATGWSRGNFSVANLVTFSARFMTARITTLGRAVRGLDLDTPFDVIPILGPRASRNLPKANPVARLEDRMARRAVMRMIGYGTMMTVAINEAQGRDTDFRPFVDGKPNSNFVRFRWGNRDWSLFGSWDSTVRLLASLGSGNFRSAARSAGSAPFVSLGWDLATNEDYFGRPIIRPEKDQFGNPIKINGEPVKVTEGDRALDIMTRFAESTVPFAADEAPEILSQIAGAAGDGHLNELGIGTAVGVAEGLGVKSSPLSNAEIKALLEDSNLDPKMRQQLEAELAKRKGGYKTGTFQRLTGAGSSTRNDSDSTSNTKPKFNPAQIR